MKILLLLSVLVLFAFFSQAQNLAIAERASATPKSYLPANQQPGSSRHTSSLANAGTYTILGGIAVGIYGYIEYKNATTTSGPFTFVNEGQQSRGQVLEYIGGLGVAAGIVMVIVGSVNNRSHQGSKVSICAPKPDQVGLAYRI